MNSIAYNRIAFGQKIKYFTRLVNAIEMRIIYLAFIVLGVLAVAYVYFVASAIITTVVYKEVRSEIVLLNTQIADMEAEFLKTKNTFTYAFAQEKGFVTITDKKFITRAVYVGKAY